MTALTRGSDKRLARTWTVGWQAAARVPLPGLDGPVGSLTFVWKRNTLGAVQQTVLAALAGYVAQALLQEQVGPPLRRVGQPHVWRAEWCPPEAQGGLPEVG